MNTGNPGKAGQRWLAIVGIISALAGIYFVVGGIWLAWLGGSWYFLLAGLMLLGSGVAIFRRKLAGAVLFALTLLFTAVWALWDVGLAFWPLFSRLFALSAGAVVIAFSVVPLLTDNRKVKLWARSLGSVMLVGVVWTFISSFQPKNIIRNADEIASLPVPDDASTDKEPANWNTWSGDNHGSRFSALSDITPENVKDLKVAWTAHTGEAVVPGTGDAADQNTPLQIGDSLYVCTAYTSLISYDIDSGKEKWRYTAGRGNSKYQRCRGVAYFDATTSKDVTSTTGEPLDASISPQRIFFPTGDGRLVAIDAHTGKPAANFGDNGVIDLKVGMGEVKPGYYQQSSAPLVAGNLVIVGGRVIDNFETGEPPGVVRAYDAVTGKLVWAWDPGNPAVTREPLSPEGYTRGTPNVWVAMSYDAELGMVYLPTGNATPDFYAGERTALDDKYGSSVVALNVATGRPVWSFQTVHHDLWDFDVTGQPLLYDIPNDDGSVTPALAEVSKTGMIYLLDRRNGKPLADIKELPVPQGNAPGERYSPTQPYSTGMPGIGNEVLTESDMWGATPFDQLICRIRFKSSRYDGIFTPPGLDTAIQYPGSLGGMNWGGVSVDPTTNLMYVNDLRLGLYHYLVPAKDIPPGLGSSEEMGIVVQKGLPYGSMRQRFMSPLGVPCQAPPFGTLSAINLKTHKLVWQVPVGTVQDTGPLGIPVGLKMPLGMPTLGPSLATRSGLIFFAGTQDFYLRAFNSRTGEEVWKSRLPVGTQSGPITYRSKKTGKQYVVIFAGGSPHSPKTGDDIIAYSLP
ncbi:membrane-bound PQQ-dependent dehydrogenase, glucose/quinate/shikimate family [Pantoea sp. FN0302]|uniref:membrane-bound PQQ-dependent dehydrogenase, glucose/quinate/shikimate family n=1 Tax=unclassified Pantoea TaxID=2630326 RepID=UPI003CF25F1C